MRNTSMEMENIYTRKLSEFAASCRFEQIPKNVVEHAKICLLDSLGCGLFGSTLPWPKIMIEVLLAHDRESEASLLGSPKRCSIFHAPLINGTMIHGFELDDLHKRSIVHPGSVVIPAALATAEWLGKTSGRDFLAAMIAGYEVGARVGMSVGVPHLNMGWHPTGTNGTFRGCCCSRKPSPPLAGSDGSCPWNSRFTGCRPHGLPVQLDGQTLSRRESFSERSVRCLSGPKRVLPGSRISWKAPTGDFAAPPPPSTI